MNTRIGVAALVVFLPFAAWTQSDFQFTLNNIGSLDYTIAAVSSTQIYDGQLGAADPTLTLKVGKRYEVTVVNSGPHPFELLAKGSSSSSDTVLLSQRNGVDPFENDPDVDWVDDGAFSNGKVEFTVTEGLVEAMNAGSSVPGYRCGVHISTMRGNFEIAGERIQNPISQVIAKGDIVVELETVADGLTSPLGAVFAADDASKMYVYDQEGFVWLYVDGVKQTTPFLDVTNRIVSLGVSGPDSFDERGLIGLALHPGFPGSRKVYTYTSEPMDGTADFTVELSSGSHDHQAVIAEWLLNPLDPNVVLTSSRRELLRIDEPQFNHDGGTIRFGSDGLLYIALGDGGRADDDADGHGTTGNGQNAGNVLGTLLRIDVDGGGTTSSNGQYGVPTSNPFVGTAGVDEIFAYGFRNPYSFSFDSETGDLYLGDVGQNDIEEIDIVVMGGNYGWNVKEGSFFFNPNGANSGFVTDTPAAETVPDDLIEPVAEYDHDDGAAVVGGYVYRGTALPELSGVYVFGEYLLSDSGRLFYLDGAEILEMQIGEDDRTLGIFVKGFGQDPNGEIYVCGSESVTPFGDTGKVFKLVAVEVTLDDPRDLNGDNSLDAVDVQLVINAALGVDIGEANADVDQDGAVNAVDVQLVINGVLGL